MQLHLTSDFLSARTSPFFQLVFQPGFPSSFPPLQWGPVSKTLCPHFILLADFSIPKRCASICRYITVLSINGSSGYLKEFQSHVVFKEHHLRRWIELVWKEAEALPAPAGGLDCLLRSSRAGHQEASEYCTMTSCSPWSYPGWATAPVSQWVSSRMAPPTAVLIRTGWEQGSQQAQIPSMPWWGRMTHITQRLTVATCYSPELHAFRHIHNVSEHTFKRETTVRKQSAREIVWNEEACLKCFRQFQHIQHCLRYKEKFQESHLKFQSRSSFVF